MDAGFKKKKQNYMCQVQSRPTQNVGQTEKWTETATLCVSLFRQTTQKPSTNL